MRLEKSLGLSFWRTNPNQSGLDAMHEKSPSLLGEINVVLLLLYKFHSVKSTPITRELLQKIIMNSLGFVKNTCFLITQYMFS
jgi:hypothetical protein